MIGKIGSDRYHATAVETGEHLLQCVVYIDLNMVRTGRIRHPFEWSWCGFNEIREPRRKNVLISYEKLRELAGFEIFGNFQTAHRKWADGSLAKCGYVKVTGLRALPWAAGSSLKKIILS